MYTSDPSFSSRIGNLGVMLLLIGMALGTLSLLSGVTRLGVVGVGLFAGAAMLLGLMRLLIRGW